MATYHEYLTDEDSARLANIIVDVAELLRLRAELNAEAEKIRRLARNRMARAQMRKRREADRKIIDAGWAQILDGAA